MGRKCVHMRERERVRVCVCVCACVEREKGTGTRAPKTHTLFLSFFLSFFLSSFFFLLSFLSFLSSPDAKQNGGEFEFSDTQYATVVPLEQRFWDFLMSTSKKWGLAVYEQVKGADLKGDTARVGGGRGVAVAEGHSLLRQSRLRS